MAGQIFYETIRPVHPEEELCLGARDPIQLDGGESGAGGNDAIGEDNKEVAGEHEKDGEDEKEEIEDNGVKCLVCDKIYPDVYV